MQVQDYAFWMAATRELLFRCDAIIFTHNYMLSSGAKAEELTAMHNNIPRFYDVKALEMWLRHGEER